MELSSLPPAGAGSGAGQGVASTDVGCVAAGTGVGRIAAAGAGVGRIAAAAPAAASAVLASQRLGLGAAVVAVVAALVLLVEREGARHPGAGSVSCPRVSPPAVHSRREGG